MKITHQWIEGDKFEYALDREEACEDDVQVFQHGLVHFWSAIKLRAEDEKWDTEYLLLNIFNHI